MRYSKSTLLASCCVLLLIALAGCGKKLSPPVNDRVGNSYPVVELASKTWMTKNLEVEHYRNGDPIPQVQNAEEWAQLTTGAWCYAGNNPEEGKTYGKLYNWYAVADPRGIAPEGWHVATDAEWQALCKAFGGLDAAGAALKATGEWKNSTPENATNSSGFNALPGGARRDTDGYFMPTGEYSRLWTSTEIAERSAWAVSLGYYDAAVRLSLIHISQGIVR